MFRAASKGECDKGSVDLLRFCTVVHFWGNINEISGLKCAVIFANGVIYTAGKHYVNFALAVIMWRRNSQIDRR